MALGTSEKWRTAIHYVFNHVQRSPLKELWDDSASFQYPSWLKNYMMRVIFFKEIWNQSVWMASHGLTMARLWSQQWSVRGGWS